MAIKVNLKHKDSGIMKDEYFGFSWTTLFFGSFPALFRGDFRTFVGVFLIIVIIGILTAGIGAFIAMIIWAFNYNKYYTRELLENGYVFNDSEAIRKQAALALGITLNEPNANCSNISVASETPHNINSIIPSTNTYQIVITGHKKEMDVDLVLNNLATLLKRDIEIIRPLLASKKFIIKRSLDINTANKYQKFLENLGCIVVIESELHFELPKSTHQKHSSEKPLSSVDKITTVQVKNENHSTNSNVISQSAKRSAVLSDLYE